MTEHSTPSLTSLIEAAVRDAAGPCQLRNTRWCYGHESHAPHATTCDAMNTYLEIATDAVHVTLEGVLAGIDTARTLTMVPEPNDFARGVGYALAATSDNLRAIIDELSA